MSPTGQEHEAKGSRRTNPGGFDGPRVPGRCASVGRHAPEDDSVPLHDVVVLRRPVDAFRRVVLHPLEITHKPSPCRRRHGGERSCRPPASARKHLFVHQVSTGMVRSFHPCLSRVFHRTAQESNGSSDESTDRLCDLCVWGRTLLERTQGAPCLEHRGWTELGGRDGRAGALRTHTNRGVYLLPVTL